MAVCQLRSVTFGLACAAFALVASGCATPAPAASSGQLELRLDSEASYALVGRFRVNSIDPWSPSRDIDFDAATSRARIELPPGTFALALGAGARLVCVGDDAAPSGETAAGVRLVSASPRVITIAPGGLTRARIGFGAAPGHAADPGDPCGERVAVAAPASLEH